MYIYRSDAIKWMTIPFPSCSYVPLPPIFKIFLECTSLVLEWIRDILSFSLFLMEFYQHPVSYCICHYESNGLLQRRFLSPSRAVNRIEGSCKINETNDDRLWHLNFPTLYSTWIFDLHIVWLEALLLSHSYKSIQQKKGKNSQRYLAG